MSYETTAPVATAKRDSPTMAGASYRESNAYTRSGGLQATGAGIGIREGGQGTNAEMAGRKSSSSKGASMKKGAKPPSGNGGNGGYGNGYGDDGYGSSEYGDDSYGNSEYGVEEYKNDELSRFMNKGATGAGATASNAVRKGAAGTGAAKAGSMGTGAAQAAPTSKKASGADANATSARAAGANATRALHMGGDGGHEESYPSARAGRMEEPAENRRYRDGSTARQAGGTANGKTTGFMEAAKNKVEDFLDADLDRDGFVGEPHGRRDVA